MTYLREKNFVIFISLLLFTLTIPLAAQKGLTTNQYEDAMPEFQDQSKYIFRINSPILMPTGNGFERDRVYNPTVIVEEDKIYMIYRAEGAGTGTGTFGLAESKDGLTFARYENNPIFVAENDFEKKGCEDPRVIKIDGTYYLFYVGNSNKTPGKICLAISKNLVNWDKYGPILQPKQDWESKQIKAPAPVPQKINGKYWVYYQGERKAWRTKMGLAYSDDLIHWAQASDKPVMQPREGYFDSWGVEPGVSVIIDEGILLVYNGWGGDSTNINKTGWALFNKEDPTKLITRCSLPIISLPNDHVFAEGLIKFKGKWYLYYGAADSRIEGIIVDFEQLISKALKI